MTKPDEGTALKEQAKALVREGWLSTSNQYHRLARFKPGFEASDLIRPEVLHTPAGKALAEIWEQQRRGLLRSANTEFVEHKTVSPALFHAFRSMGGQSA